MRNDLVLGIDAGTASLRAGLFTLQGQPLGFYDQSYQTSYPQPGWAEQHPGDWWNALVAAVRGCLTESGADATQVIGMAIDAPCNILLTDSQGTPLTESLIWMDLRATEQAKTITQTSDPVLRYCGGDVPAEWPVPKALWLKQQNPKLWEQATYLVEQMSWLTWKLTGEQAIPLNSAAAKWHYRANTTDSTPAGWPIHLLDAVGLGDLPDKLVGRVLPMGMKAGELTRQAAQELGLPPGIAVSMSGIDAHAGMIGLNVLAPGSLALITGTSTCQLVQSSQAIVDPGLWGPFEDAVVTGEWTIEAGQASTGGTVRWLLDTFGGSIAGKADLYGEADAAAAAIRAGSEGLTVLDFWQGSRTPIKDPTARGTIWGLTPAHTRGHLLRAVYEGTAYGNRHILEKLAELGVPTQYIMACGGGTRSTLWLQILADVAAIPITLTSEPDAVTLGSAICAAVGAGAFTDLRSAARAMVHPGKTIEPDKKTQSIYEEGYARYLATYDALKPLFQHS
ncbi:MAG TPA: FGGY-family carbohydrate kinase [Ktedonobacteraceae bacterium]|nr:FGGY-family carbohydrate kinase [Ktedonobacteraceae bacterium]